MIVILSCDLPSTQAAVKAHEPQKPAQIARARVAPVS